MATQSSAWTGEKPRKAGNGAGRGSAVRSGEKVAPFSQTGSARETRTRAAQAHVYHEGSKEVRKLTHLVRQDIDDSNYYIKNLPLSDTYNQVLRKHAEELFSEGILPRGTKNDARLVV